MSNSIPTPIKRDGTTNYHTGTDDFPNWLAKTKLTRMKSAEADKWFAENKAQFQPIYDKYWAMFQTKDSEHKQAGFNFDLSELYAPVLRGLFEPLLNCLVAVG